VLLPGRLSAKQKKKKKVPGTRYLWLTVSSTVVGFDIEKNFTSNLHTSTLQHKTKLNTFEFFSTQSHAVRIARLDAEKAADTKDKLEMISPGKNFKSKLPSEHVCPESNKKLMAVCIYYPVPVIPSTLSSYFNVHASWWKWYFAAATRMKQFGSPFLFSISISTAGIQVKQTQR
jgi:hypothetical protein